MELKPKKRQRQNAGLLLNIAARHGEQSRDDKTRSDGTTSWECVERHRKTLLLILNIHC